MEIPDGLLSRFSDFVVARLGLYFPPSRRHDLERGILAACREFGRDDVEDCVRWLMSAPLNQERMEALAGNLTVGETYFFRDGPTFDLLQQRLLPELIASRRGADRRLRIWSAGCSSGEEPYSLAILLTELLPDLAAWNITILGTDINRRALRRASTGVYRNWSFRNAPRRLKERYVRDTGHGYEIIPAIRQMVTFSYHNLVEDPYPSVANNTNAMDLILCRNVLMYLTTEVAERVVEGFHRSLLEEGWLIVGPGEGMPGLFSAFEQVSLSGVTLFRRPPAGVSPPLTPVPPWEAEQAPPEETACDELATVIPASSQPFDQALVLYQGGRYEEAAELLRTVDEPRAHALLAKVYANQGALSEALSWCEKAVAADKLNPNHRYLRASILQEGGRNDDAMESLKGALYLSPDFILAHVALGNLLRKQGQAEAAQHHFRNALALLQHRPQQELVPESEGITAGRLMEAIQSAQPESRA